MPRNGNLLLIAIFMLSMLFTVFNYLPIIEEESPTQRIELCKKNNQDPTNSEDGNELDEDSASEFLSINTNIISLYDNTIHFCKLAVKPCRDFDSSHIKPPPRA